jgi:hypothetical protein
MANEFAVLSPRGDVDPIPRIGLNPRLTDLNKATIGLYATFKEHWVLILEEIGKQLKELYPGIQFTRFQYTKDLNPYTQVAELAKDTEERAGFEEWIKGVDGVVVANADAGSCTLYLTYNATLPEHLGKPTVLTVASDFIDLLKRAAELRGVPALRYAPLEILDIAMEPDMTPWVERIIPACVRAALPAIIAGLTEPLTPEEAAVPAAPENDSRVATKGTIDEIYASFYRRGWAYGMPIMPPTEDAVNEMLTGSDLPAGHVVATLPPQMGKATVEKIAVNAVMAGCLPTHMPALIAAVEAMADPHMWLEAYTCSVASWAPLLMVNGPVRRDLDLTVGSTLLTPYRRGNAAIAHAVGLILMNIAGIKAGREDMAMFGHEGRFGMCIAEYEEESPWEPMHVYYGLDKDDSAITVSWPNTRYFAMMPEDVGVVMKSICEGIPAFGFDPGCTMIMSPQLAKFLHAHGLSRKGVVDYIVEYARVSASDIPMRWMIGHHHEPKTVPLPLDPTRSARKYWSGMHLPIIVAGGNGIALLFYGGGGDHGGPITKKIRLPKNWPELVARYKERGAGS